ncbi:MAG: pitrilysin family protein [Pseudomonadota bacterium]
MKLNPMILLLILPLALILSCGPAVAPSPPEYKADDEFIDAKVSYIETSQGVKLGPTAAKKVPMPEIEKKFDYKFPEVNRKALPNGFGVHHVSLTRLPLVSVEIAFRAGSAHDKDELAGLAVFVGEMLKGGTKSRTSKDIAQELETLGIDLGVWTTSDATVLSFTCLKEHFPTAVELAADMIMGSTFPDEEIEIFRNREIGRLTLDQSDPYWQAGREFAAQVYGPHPYSRYDATEESLKKITKKDIHKFHKLAYCGSNGFATIVGDIDFKTAAATIAKHFKKMPKGKALKLKKSAVPERSGKDIVIVDRPGSVQTVFKIGVTAIERKNPDYTPLTVANHILGGSVTSRLFLRIREKESLAYSIRSTISRSVATGAWYVAGSTTTETTDRLLKGTFEEIEKITKEQASQTEIEEAKLYLTGSFPLMIETTDQIAARVTDMVVFGLPDDYWGTYLADINDVSPDDVQSMAAKYFTPHRLLVVLVGDAEKIKGLMSDNDNVTVVNK